MERETFVKPQIEFLNIICFTDIFQVELILVEEST